MKMKKLWKRVAGIVLASALSLTFVLSSVNVAFAEEGDGSYSEEDVLEAAPYKVGDIIKFGHYEQDGNEENGKEEIEWEVLKVESDRVLVVSKYALDCKPYNTEYTDVTWETCTLRKWLNNDFKNAAFTSAEQAKIPTVTVVNENNPYYRTAGGNNTKDQIFCLSVNEIKNLIGYNWYNDQHMYGYSQKMIVEPTQYAINNGAYVYTITEDYYNSYLKGFGYTSDVIGRRGAWWWLRSPGSGSGDACGVSGDGSAGASYGGNVSSDDIAVRPALYFLNPTTVNPESITMGVSSWTMAKGKSALLGATLLPKNVTETAVTWTSSNPAVAVVASSGEISRVSIAQIDGKGVGTAVITATTVNGLTATCEVTVLIDDVKDNIFADVVYDSWQYKAAKSVYEKGYMTGKGTLGGKVVFSPDTDINRSQFVVALYSMAGKPSVTYHQQFDDVKESDWYAKAITWAADNGIVAGKGNKFDISGQATREQLALMFYKYAKYKNYDVSIKASTNLDKFTDAAKVDSWALDAVKWAVERGIITGKGNAETGLRIDPLKGATRAECAAMMNKFDEVYSGGLKAAFEEEEEPLALPAEDMEEAPAPEEEIEDTIDDEDEIDEEDIIDEEDKDSEEEAEDPIDEEM